MSCARHVTWRKRSPASWCWIRFCHCCAPATPSSTWDPGRGVRHGFQPQSTLNSAKDRPLLSIPATFDFFWQHPFHGLSFPAAFASQSMNSESWLVNSTLPLPQKEKADTTSSIRCPVAQWFVHQWGHGHLSNTNQWLWSPFGVWRYTIVTFEGILMINSWIFGVPNFWTPDGDQTSSHQHRG